LQTWADAAALKDEAAGLCARGNYKDGIVKLEQAFRCEQLRGAGVERPDIVTPTDQLPPYLAGASAV
jgi:hypothetical protein